MTSRWTNSLIGQYTLACVLVVLAMLVEHWTGVAETGVTPVFFAAVMLSAWVGGVGPGLLATLLATVGSAHVLMASGLSPHARAEDVMRLIAFLGVAILISTLHSATRRSQAKLTQALEEAHAASQAKDRFLAMVSHELRNPLNPVLAAAAAQKLDQSLPESVREDAAMIRRNIELEVRLIDDLLDLSRLRAGKLSYDFQQIDVCSLIQDVVSMVQGDMEHKGIEVTTRFGGQARYVRGDSTRLRQVIWNLLRNAAKFTPVGGKVTIGTCDAPDGRLLIEVSDTGIGIPSNSLTRIFNAFEQASDATTRQFGGLGLGLAIAQRIVTAHGGTIGAASEGENRGSTFTISLPVLTDVKEQLPAIQRNTRADTSSPLGPVKILLVEDHEDTAQLLRRLLQRDGHCVEVAGSRACALQMVRGLRFDLLLSDLTLPDGSGLDIVRELRSMGRSTPAIALSGYGMSEDISRSREAGFAEHLLKPVALDALRLAMRRVLAQPSDASGHPLAGG